MHILLVIISILVSMVGLALLSPATQGVGVIAFACLLAIFARIAQAGTHNADNDKFAKQQADLRWRQSQPQSEPTAAHPA